MQNSQQVFVLDLLKEKLSPFYYYHNIAHTLYVQTKAVEIGRAEGCSAADIELLSTAAIWHDTGFIHTYMRHEEESCVLVKKYLQEHGDCSEKDVDAIIGMIMATRMPQSPHNKLEEIIADADLEYLGTTMATPQAENLFRELQHRNPTLTRRQWRTTQIAFLQNHQYFTSFCKQNSEPFKKEYLKELLKESEWPIPGGR